MAIHDFKCLTCGTEFEFMKIRSDERVECPKCEEKEESKLEQLISKDTSFILKGGGWFGDNYS